MWGLKLIGNPFLSGYYIIKTKVDQGQLAAFFLSLRSPFGLLTLFSPQNKVRGWHISKSLLQSTYSDTCLERYIPEEFRFENLVEKFLLLRNLHMFELWVVVRIQCWQTFSMKQKWPTPVPITNILSLKLNHKKTHNAPSTDPRNRR